MSLFLATLLSGLTLLVLGAVLLWNTRTVAAVARTFPRSTQAAYVCMGLATVWFLYLVANLSEADFGAYRNLLVLAFGGIAVSSFFHAREFLAVRGAAILVLLSAHVLLDAAFMEPQASRLFLVSFVYVAILAALYLGVSPYRLRDFFGWLFASPGRPRVLGGVLLGYGVLLNVAAFTY